MSATGSNVSYFALMQRELGIRPPFRNSVFDPPKVVDEKPTISKTVQGQTCCLVINNTFEELKKDSIMKKKKKIYELVTTPGLDYRDLSCELKKCWKKGTSGYHGTFTHRRTVIDGIKLRAKEIFPNDPTYEERQRKELDKMLESNIRRLYYSILTDERLK
jgi:hypothetical protein